MIQFRSPAPLPVGYRVTLRNLIGIVALAVLVFVLLGVIVVQIEDDIFSPERNRAESLLWFALLAFTAVMVATGYVLAWRSPQRWGIIGLVRPHPRWILIAVASGAVLFFLGERLDDAFRFGILADFEREFGAAIATEVGLLSMLAARALLLPVALEVLFRGVLLNFLANRLGQEAGLFVSALLFAGLFFNAELPISMAYGFIYGLVYGLLFLRSGSLWTAIVAHGTLGALIVAKVAWV